MAAHRDLPPHDSMVRLLAFAIEATRRSKNPIRGYSDLGVRLDATAGAFSNWKRRGISKEGAIRAEREFGCSAHWVMTGDGQREVGPPPPPKPAPGFKDRDMPSSTEWSFLDDLRYLPDDEQEEYRRQVRERAEKFKAYREQVIAGMKGKH